MVRQIETHSDEKFKESGIFSLVGGLEHFLIFPYIGKNNPN